MRKLLVCEKLLKTHGSSFTLGPVDFTINSQEVAGFIGANGAGKSTLFQMLSANTDASEGRVYYNKQRVTPDNAELRKQFGYLPQHPVLPKWVSATDLLKYAASVYNLSNAAELIKSQLKYWDIEFFESRPLAACSHGMQKRVGLALATIHSPDFLILDEPFSGLDIFHIQALKRKISDRVQEGKITILSTHITPYTAKMCDRAFIVKSGNIQEIESWPQMHTDDRVSHIENEFFGKPHEL